MTDRYSAESAKPTQRFWSGVRPNMASSSLTVSVSEFMTTSSRIAGSPSSPNRPRRLHTFGGADRFARVGSARGDGRPDLRPGLNSTLDLQAATELRRALAHRVQTEVARVFAFGIEAYPVIPDLQPDLGVILVQDNSNARGARVAARIVQRFLGNSVEGLLALPTHRGFARERFLDRNAVP